MARVRAGWTALTGLAVALAGLAPAAGSDAVAPASVPVIAPSSIVSDFADVPPSHPFHTEISWLAGESITTGFPDGTFHPGANVERQAMAAFLYRYAGHPAYTAPATARFSDVPTSSPFYTEISWLAEQGITTGYGDGGFHPTEAVSRQAMAAFLYRFAHSPAFTPPGTARFSDVPVGATFRVEVEWLASTGITTGYPDGSFHPNANVERQAMAAFLYRAQPLRPPVTLPLTATPTSTITGTAAVGSTLTAHAGTWAPAGVILAYQWSANAVAIPSATGATYTVTANEIGKTITVTVTGSKAGYATASRTSTATSAVPTPPAQGVVAVRTQRMSDATLNSAQNGWYEAGARLNLVCYRTGQSVQGYFSPYVGNGGWDSMWYKVSDGYFVADIDLETGTLEPVVDQCAGSSPTATTNATVMATTQRMSDATLNSTQSGTYGAGARLTLTCYKHGQAVQGYYSPYLPNGGWDDLWYKVNDNYYVADVDIDTGSNNPVTPACSPPPQTDGNTILTRARSWIDAAVPYNQSRFYTNQYGTYRQDCSGFVSMALGLPSSYVTNTLPQVLHRINKDDLQPGDIMLNTATGNYGHTAIFVRWADAGHTRYVSWEENGAAGYTFEQTVPYPYWPSWPGSTNYFPYRR